MIRFIKTDDYADIPFHVFVRSFFACVLAFLLVAFTVISFSAWKIDVSGARYVMISASFICALTYKICWEFKK